MPQQPKPLKPVFISFLIADTVIQEKITNKWSVIGVFDRINSNLFPYIHPNLGLYIRITDASGKYAIRVEFCDENNNILSQFEGIHIEVTNRLAAPGFGIQTRNLPIPKPGNYSFNLYFNDDFFQSLPVAVTQS